MPSHRPAILVVCTGNICRSPAAATLLAASLGPGASVASAGTQAVVGSAATPDMVRLVTAAGLRLDGFAARQLTAEMVARSDLVLTMTREHRSSVVTLVPRAVRRTFTLRELARLLAAAGPLPGEDGTAPGGDAVPALVAALPGLAALRHPHPLGAAADDIDDPFGGPAAGYQRAWSEITAAVTTMTTAVQARAAG